MDCDLTFPIFPVINLNLLIRKQNGWKKNKMVFSETKSTDPDHKLDSLLPNRQPGWLSSLICRAQQVPAQISAITSQEEDCSFLKIATTFME